MFCVRHRAEEMEVKQVTVAVASKVAFPTVVVETRPENSPTLLSYFIMPPTARDKLAKSRASTAREKTPPSPDNSDDG